HLTTMTCFHCALYILHLDLHPSPTRRSSDLNALTDRELEPLKRVWAAHKRELKAGGALEQFEKRLRREWAIETGIIEKVYSLDRDRKSTRLNSSHGSTSYAFFCLKKKTE